MIENHEKDNYRVAAVVVTFNRLELLKQCINALRNQTRKLDEIIIVNNHSTDGTLEWLEQQNDLTFITQENSGSAGGQRTGIKTAYEKGYDWIWCMDDDGWAASTALYNLLKYNDNVTLVKNSLVVDPENENELSFGFYDINLKEYLTKKKELKGQVYEGVANYFNGTLINRKVIDKVGLPIKEFFIRGEEIEYAFRILKCGVKQASVLNSIFYHKPEKYYLIKTKYFSHKFLFLNNVKRFHHNRNLIWIQRMHGIFGPLMLLKTFIFDFLLIIFFQFKFILIVKLIKGYTHGVIANPKEFETR